MSAMLLRILGFLTLLSLSVLVLLITLVLKGHVPSEVTEMSKAESKYFGRGTRPSQEDESIRRFRVNFTSEMISELRGRIKSDLDRLAPPLEDANFIYGFNSDYLREVAKYWMESYDFKSQEALLNSLPHFKTTIDGLDVHYIHIKADTSKLPNVPILLVHGWPGSFFEFYKLVSILRENDKFAFDIVVPSIPGYGFSSAPAKRGFDVAQCARIFNTLMTKRLNFDRYYAQGGDWGSGIVLSASLMYPENLKGIHLNMMSNMAPALQLKILLAHFLPSGWLLDQRDEMQLVPYSSVFNYLVSEMGYALIQATKPDTVGTALSHSPLGLAAYILEKFSTWTNREGRDAADGLLTNKFTLDDLITNLMIYWTSNCITSSQRFYAENMRHSDRLNTLASNVVVGIPSAVAAFPNEIQPISESAARHTFRDLVQFSHMARGGHFAAFEEPRLLAEDVVAFIQKVENRDEGPIKSKATNNNQQKKEF